MLTFSTTPNVPGDREVNASVSANRVDPNSSNNVATDTIEIIAPPMEDSIFHDRFRNFQ